MEIFEQIITSLRFYLVLPIIIFIWYFFIWIKVQFKFGKNLRREVYFLKTSEDKKLQTQKDQIKNIKLFRINDDIKDISTEINVIQNLGKKSIFIVGYSKNFNYKELFDYAKNNKIAVIIFAKQGEIKQEHFARFNDYIYCDVANTSNRLLIILINTLKII